MTPLLAAVVGFAAGATVILGLARWIWWLVLPRIREQITGQLTQLDEIHTATTKNSHATPGNPTIRDDLSDIKFTLRLISKRLDGVEEWVQRESDDADREHEDIRARVEALRPDES